MGNEKINTDIITLTRFLTEEQSKHKEATGDFTYVKPLSCRSLRKKLMAAILVFYAMPSNSLSRALPTTSEEQHLSTYAPSGAPTYRTTVTDSKSSLAYKALPTRRATSKRNST